MKPYLRHKARYLAVQALYDWQSSPISVADLLVRSLSGEDNQKKIDNEYFTRLISNTVNSIDEVDELLITCVDRNLHEVSHVELAILRVGASELKFCPDVPYKVILNEAMEMAKIFGGKNSHKYINGVLDKIAHRLRKDIV